MIILHDEAYYNSRKPQPDLGPLKNFLRFLWNGEKKTFLERTAKEWGQLGMFYLCFFSVLGTIFTVQLLLSINYVSELDKPFFEYTPVSTRAYFRNFPLFRSPWNFGNPGISYKPNAWLPTTSPIIWVDNSSVSARPKRYVQALTDFLQEYKKNTSDYDLNCDRQKLRTSLADKPCYFDIKQLGACARPPYGYTKTLQPCVLISFNKRFNWVPNNYNRSTELPKNMPDSLRQVVQSSKKLRTWMSCDGVNSVDKEHIGDIEYIPSPGFPVEFFPFIGQNEYLSPIVALQFKSLTPNRLVTVECSLWAFNIDQHSRYALDFQIMIGKEGGTHRNNRKGLSFITS
ncbi:hypothetical protein KM043_015032 [Ampulex compressa]|nr:hypothetical protein KM043_015032 [Ampulex compressa]